MKPSIIDVVMFIIIFLKFSAMSLLIGFGIGFIIGFVGKIYTMRNSNNSKKF